MSRTSDKVFECYALLTEYLQHTCSLQTDSGKIHTHHPLHNNMEYSPPGTVEGGFLDKVRRK